MLRGAPRQSPIVAPAQKVEPPNTSTPPQTSSTRATTTANHSNGERSSRIPIISRSRPLAPPRSPADPASHIDEPVSRGRQPKRQRDRTSPPRNKSKDPLAGLKGDHAAAAQAGHRRKKNLKFCDSPPPKYKIWEEESMKCVRREISP